MIVAPLYVLVASIDILAAAASSGAPQVVDLFVGGQGGYPAYRIPAQITTRRGSLLAFAEGRTSLRDHAENKIVMKRSMDGGNTWEPLQSDCTALVRAHRSILNGRS
ncbi:MAG TPA: sialidase family protein [Verrucomicrobiae bacterium]|nr:sialidase family protein [Verrucomicrobiae bacterium]